MHEYEAIITRTEPIGRSIFLLEIDAPELSGSVTPGQFLQMRAGEGTDPFLRRTVSVCGADPAAGIIRLVIEVIGRGTEFLCSRSNSTPVNVIGPLGNGFELAIPENGPVWMVAGGIGAAPLIFLSNELNRLNGNELTFFAGARHREGIAIVDRLLAQVIPVEKSTDDGSVGHHGFVTELVAARMKKTVPSVIHTCGPRAMMREVSLLAAHAGCRCEVSLEERMACGMGACYGCTVKLTTGRMARVCTEGPVFDSGMIAWE